MLITSPLPSLGLGLFSGMGNVQQLLVDQLFVAVRTPWFLLLLNLTFQLDLVGLEPADFLFPFFVFDLIEVLDVLFEVLRLDLFLELPKPFLLFPFLHLDV